MSNEFNSEVINGEIQIQNAIRKVDTKYRMEEIYNSIMHINNSLDKYIANNKKEDIENVYWHIGAIKAYSKF